MTHRPILRRSSGPALSIVLLAALLLGGCDAGGAGGETAILNATSPVPPTVDYTVRYEAENVGPDGNVVVDSSDATDTLTGILGQNGFDRASVVSARVDSVELRSRSGMFAASVRPKVFDYLNGATVFFGTGSARTQIASGSFTTTQDEVTFASGVRVTEQVTAGPQKLLLRLDASAGEVPSTDAVDVTVYFRVEVGGV
jgi:hypothetical protein